MECACMFRRGGCALRVQFRGALKMTEAVLLLGF
jgi:hypothetical protein